MSATPTESKQKVQSSSGLPKSESRQFRLGSLLKGLEEQRSRDIPRQLCDLNPKLTVIPAFKCVSARKMQNEAPIPGFDRYIFPLSESDGKKEGDTLTIVSKHATGHRRLILKTRDPKIAAALPNKLVSSLTGKLEQELQKYQIRIDGYKRQAKRCADQKTNRVTAEVKAYDEKDENSGLSPVEQEKARIIEALLKEIRNRKPKERQISKRRDTSEQEDFRNELFKLIENAITKNRIATNTFATGEGYLNEISYNAKILCQNYEFNPHKEVTLADQNDFSEKEAGKFFLWDSDKNMDGSDEDIQTALFSLVQTYNLEQDFNHEDDSHFHPLSFEESSRVGRLDQALEERKKGLRQVADYFGGDVSLDPHKSAVEVDTKQLDEKEKVFKKPTERDLFVVADLAKRNFYWWHRVVIQLKLFKERVPEAIRYEVDSAKHWFHDVWRRFNNDIDEEYIPKQNQDTDQPLAISAERKEAVSTQLEVSLKKTGLLRENESLDDFIKRIESSYHPVKSDNEAVKTEYHNPVSLGLHVIKAFGNFFRHYSEKNPITGTLGLAAYAYGASAVLAPAALAALLSKLHLHFLTTGIQPTQGLAGFLASGSDSRAIAAGFTYWKMIAVSADADSLLIETVKQFEDDPVSLVFIIGVAIGLGYVTCKMVPAFEEELGTFPLYGQLVMGFKVGAGLADTIYNPRSNVFSKILDWASGIPVLAMRTIIDPIVETCRHEKNNWILNGVGDFLNNYFFKFLDYLFNEYREAGFFIVLFSCITMAIILPVAALGFLLPRWVTTHLFTKESLKQSFDENIFFQFGKTVFLKEGYDFLPAFLEYDCYDDYSVFHPVRISGRLLTALVNFLFLIFYILAPILKLIAFVTGFVLPTYFTSKPFAKAMHRLFKRLAEGLDALFNIILTLLKLLFDELPGFLHIVYRGVAKLIAKTLGTLGEPGLLAELLIRFATRKPNTHFSREGKFKLRWNPNYGFDKASWHYIDSGIAHWPLVLHVLFFIIAAPLLLIKDIIKNILILISDIFGVLLRFLVLVVDLISRALAMILGGIFKFLDILMNADRYLAAWRGQKIEKNSLVPTLGCFFRELGKAVIYLTDDIDQFFGEIKRSFLSGITRAEIESRRQLLLDPVDNPSQERRAVFSGWQAQTLARLVIATGGHKDSEQALTRISEYGQEVPAKVEYEITRVLSS